MAGDQDRGLVVPQQHELFFRSEQSLRDDAAFDEFRAILVGLPPIHEAEIEIDLQNILPCHAGGEQGTGDQFPRDGEILFGEPTDRRFENTSRGGMDAHHIPKWHGEQPVRIILAEIVAGGKRDVLEIGNGFHAGGFDAVFLQAVAIEGDVLARSIQGALEPFQLELGALFRIEAFFPGIPNGHVQALPS